MLQNLVTLPAAAIRTSASLSRSSRPYAGTSSVLFPVDTRMSVHPVYIPREAHIHIAWLSVLAVEIKLCDQFLSGEGRTSSISSTLRGDATTCQPIFTHTTGEGRQMKATDFHLVGSGPTASQSSYNWLATM
jgi:hypothetical protein